MVSRRALSVPAIETRADAIDICRSRYFPQPLPDFFSERFGISLGEKELNEMYERGLWERGRLLEVGSDGDVSHLESVVDFLWERIRTHALAERRLATEYLAGAGLLSVRDACVVDVGYSGTIQKAMMRVSGKPVGGLYMLTSARAKELNRIPGAKTEGCFGEWFQSHQEGSLMNRQSFLLEKLLSADQGQLLRYVRGSEGIGVELRATGPEERRAVPVRKELRAGADAFVSRALQLTDLCDDWFVPPETARALFEAYCSNPSPADKQIHASLACDDYYSGRGITA